MTIPRACLLALCLAAAQPCFAAPEVDWQGASRREEGAGLLESLGLQVRSDLGDKPWSAARLDWSATTLEQFCLQQRGGIARVLPGSDCRSTYEKVQFQVLHPGAAEPANYLLHLHFDDTQPEIRPGDRQNLPVVLVTHMPHPKLMNALCMDIARQGMLCAYLEIPKDSTWDLDPKKPLEMIENIRGGITRALLAGGFSLDYLRGRPEADPRHAGLLGISLGGITASLLAQRDPKVRSVVLLLSGAGLADIIMENQDKWVLEFTGELSRLTGDPAGLRGFLENEFEGVEPFRGVERMRGLSVMMVNPIDDPIIPAGIPQRYAAEMERNGARVTAVELPFRAHNTLSLLWNIPVQVRMAAAVRKSMRFLKETLK